ncbi:MAG: hydroxyacid dehydrogenase [Flavobacteriales bacterium]|nr:hydroxyacid dehydrogenase [Flavobacteriales bacterium]
MKVLFADSVHERMMSLLSGDGWECDLQYDITPEEAYDLIPNYEGLVIRSKFPVNREFIDRAGNLKWIARYGSGMENIDVAYAEEKGIRCFSAPEGNRDAVGDHALGLMLSLTKNISRSWDEVRAGKWEREANRGIELDEKTVAIIGYGNTGSALARRLRGFTTEVMVFDPYLPMIEEGMVRSVSMDEIFAQADILSLHVPLSDETRGLVNAAYLDRFIKNIYLINTSRGAVVNTSDLADAMKKGKVIGAGLDVLEYEKSSFEKLSTDAIPGPLQYLIDNPNAIITPHIAGWSYESYEKLAVFLAEKIRSVGRS